MFNFFDDFDKMFNKLTNSFNRPVKDQQPFSVYSNENGYAIICNTLGIKKEDLRINVAKEKGNPFPVLSVVGQTNLEKIGFSNSINLRIRLNIESEIETVSYETKDGLTIIYLKTKVNKPESIEATYLKDGENPLDW